MNDSTVPNCVQLEFFVQPRAVISGQVPCWNGFRILDLLNSTSSPERNLRGEFIEVIDSSDNYEKEYVSKSAVQLVAVPEANAGRGAGGAAGWKTYPFVAKSQARVTITLEGYTLTGNIHYAKGQTVRDVLNEVASFLPLTDVTIAREYQPDADVPPEHRVYGTRAFVAVNRQKIIASREERIS